MRTYTTLFTAALTTLAASIAQAQQDPLTLSAGYTMQSDSNPKRLPSNNDPQADTLGISTFGLGFNTKQSLQTLSANISLVDYHYQKSQNSNSTNTNYDANWQWAITPKVTGSLSTERINSIDELTGSRRTNSSTRFDVEYQLDGTWRLIGGGSTSRQEIPEQGTASSSDEYTNNAIEAGLQYVFSSSSTIRYKTRMGRGEYLNPEVLSTKGVGAQYAQIDNDLRLKWELGGGSTASANLTHINRTHSSHSERDYNGFNFGTSLTWAVSGKTKLSVAYSHLLEAYPTDKSNYSSTDRVSVGPAWQMSPKVGLKLKYEWSQRAYLGTPTPGQSSSRQDILGDTSISINWVPVQQLALSTSLKTASRRVNQANLDYDSTMLQITAQLTY